MCNVGMTASNIRAQATAGLLRRAVTASVEGDSTTVRETIGSLKNSLNLGSGGDLAHNLNRLYTYVIDHADTEPRDIQRMLLTLAEAWDEAVGKGIRDA